MATLAASPAPASEPTPSTDRPKHSASVREDSRAYLQSLLNRFLVVHTTDGRLFRGEFKCTDPDRNLVLAQSTEYRQPSAQQRERRAAEQAATGQDRVVVDMVSRYVDLIVVPGHHIVKIELEEFASQVKRRLELV